MAGSDRVRALPLRADPHRSTVWLTLADHFNICQAVASRSASLTGIVATAADQAAPGSRSSIDAASLHCRGMDPAEVCQQQRSRLKSFLKTS